MRPASKREVEQIKQLPQRFMSPIFGHSSLTGIPLALETSRTTFRTVPESTQSSGAVSKTPSISAKKLVWSPSEMLPESSCIITSFTPSWRWISSRCCRSFTHWASFTVGLLLCACLASTATCFSSTGKAAHDCSATPYVNVYQLTWSWKPKKYPMKVVHVFLYHQDAVASTNGSACT